MAAVTPYLHLILVSPDSACASRDFLVLGLPQACSINVVWEWEHLINHINLIRVTRRRMHKQRPTNVISIYQSYKYVQIQEVILQNMTLTLYADLIIIYDYASNLSRPSSIWVLLNFLFFGKVFKLCQ